MNRRLDLSVQYACPREGLPSPAQFRAWARAALAGGGTVTIRLVDAEEGRALNHAYRDKDHATNVLSFSYAQKPRVEGDIVICSAVAASEADAEGKSAHAHYAHLVVHGMLHLQGWDHENETDAAAMEARERKILADLGYPDPYVSYAIST
ncbi:MAG: rRNA maturation RNase YbeY [Zoogloeaceae bacterium]|jgi:probable rRNA maturation factor|nr:rRNA maturation RNase YbeY [Zoogloeaceae bacterium]